MNRSGGGILTMALLVAIIAGSTGRTVNVGTGEEARANARADSKQETPKATATGSAGKQKVGGREYEKGLLRAAVIEVMGTTVEWRLSQQSGRPRAISFMIVTVPHPTGTHLALTFDRTVEAIQQGIQDSGYFFVRAVLPWDDREYPTSSDFRARLDEQEFNRGKHKVPGMLIFRRPPASPGAGVRYLLALLVSEKPTEGIDRDQFYESLRIASLDPQRLLVLGPCFSGSFTSLADSLRDASHLGFQNVTVVSGTATNKQAIDTFIAAANQAGKANGTSVTFKTFQYTDDYAITALQQYAADVWNYEPGDLAIISEDETQYGTLDLTDTSKSDAAGRSARAEPLHLYFPRNISHLRTAYEQERKAEDVATLDRRVTRSVLKTSLGDSRQNADTVPSYANQTPVSQESVLLGLIQELEFHRTRLILLGATDPLDMLFLVRYLRTQYPAAHVVVLGEDSLLRHEAFDPAMRGIMTLTTYSLRAFAEHDLWRRRTEREDRDRVFPSSDAKAAYNAAVAIAACVVGADNGDGHQTWCDGGEFTNTALAEYGPSRFRSPGPPTESRPELKLDVLGSDGYFPVAVLTSDAVKGEYPPLASGPSTAKPEPGHISRSFTAMTVLFCGAFLVLLALLYKCSIMNTWEAAMMLAPVPRAPLRQGFTIAVCGIAYVLFILPFWVLSNAGIMDGSNRRALFAAAPPVIGAAMCFGLLWKRHSRAIASVFALIAGCAFLAGLLSMAMPHDTAFRTFIYRSVHPASGVSPLIPLLLLTSSMLWWCWHNVAGAALCDKRRPRLPDIDTDGQQSCTSVPDNFITISESGQQTLLKRMNPGHLLQSVLFIAVALLAIAAMAVGTRRPFTTFESAKFDSVLVALAATTLAMGVQECARMVQIWSEARKLLRALDAQRFRGMFNHIHGFSWAVMWRIGGGCIHELTRLLVREIEALNVAEASLPKGSGCTAWQETTDSLRQTYFALMRQKIKLRAQLQEVQPPTVVTTGGAAAAARTAPVSAPATDEGLIDSYAELQHNMADVAAVFLQQPCSPMIVPEEAPQVETPVETPCDKCAYFICLVYVKFLVSVLLRIRTLAVSAAGLFVIIALAAISYPFEPRGMIRSVLMIMFIGLMAVIGMVYAQMHRDATLSRITNTTAGTLGGDFWMRIVSLVGLPLITLLAYQFPSISRFVFSWVEPAVKSLR